MNFNQTFSVLFWLNRAKANKQGLAPIWVRITVDGRRAECSVQKQVNPDHWDAENNLVVSKCKDARSINDFLTLVKADIIRHYNILLSTKDSVSAEDVKNSYKGIKEEKRSFIQLFTQFKQQQLEKKEIDELSEGRFKRLGVLEGKVLAFLKHKFKRSDLMLEDLKLSFIVEFEHYLRTVEKIGHNTSMKHAKDLKQVMRYSVMLEYIPSSPFEHFKCSYKKVTREYLDQTELDRLYQKEFSVARLEEVRDCYLFSCYTGYAYSDAEALTKDDITIGIDGEKWIVRKRIKTDTTENVPLLPIPLEIIEKYRKHEYCKVANRLLPMNSNQRYNAYLKEIADLCGIKKKLTTHTARHTFATTVLLTNDVPMETAMELLGHTDIRTTQIYGKIVQKKVSNDMNHLRSKLKTQTHKERPSQSWNLAKTRIGLLKHNCQLSVNWVEEILRMTYREYDIAESLRPFVKVIWSMDSEDSIISGPPLHILPDTCVELVVHFRDPYKTTFSDNTTSQQERSFVVAQMKSFMKIRPNGKTGIIAVRFSALGAYHFFGLPMKAIANSEVGLRNIWGDLAAEIEEKINNARTSDQRASILQHYLHLQLSRNGHTDKTIEFCLQEIKNVKAQISVDALARKVGISTRQLVRRFDKHVGLSPKEFIRISRFICSLDLISQRQDLNLTEVAFDAGYFDQAHFIHDFKKLSGMNPTDYRSSSNVVY